MNIRLGIVDDHTLFRKGMKAIFDEVDGITVKLEAENGQHLFDTIEPHGIDVVLMDIEMPIIDGLEATLRLKEQFPLVKVIMLSTHDDDGLILSSMEKGASGYLLKTAEEEEVMMAIESVMEKGFYVNDRVSKTLLRQLTEENLVKDAYYGKVALKEIERTVLRLICEEHTTTEIADKIYRSKRAVDGYRADLLEKTGAKNTAGLVVYALRNGIF